MTTSQITQAIRHDTFATFAAWGRLVGQQLVAAGLVKTADTGQIDWDTVATMPGIGVIAGFEIYRFNDALQATKPIFIRVRYGTSSGSASTPALHVSVWGASNGAGTMSQPFIGEKQVSISQGPGGGGSPVTYTCYRPEVGGVAQAGFVGAFTANSSNGSAQFFWGVFRSVNDQGVPTTDGVVLYGASASGTSAVFIYQYSFLTNSAGFGGQILSSYALIPGAQAYTSSASGGDVNLYRHFMSFPMVRNIVGLLSYWRADFTRGVPISVPVPGGATRTFMPLGDAVISAPGETNVTLAMIWE